MKPEPVDAFTQHIMGHIDPQVFKSLNIVQLEAIRQAVSANAPVKRHPFDFRGTVPLYFFRLYFVLLVGRDKRSDVRNKELARRNSAKTFSVMMTLYLFFCALLPVAFIALYVLKSLMGIDLTEGHLTDWFQ